MSEERIDTYRLKKVQWKGKTIPIVMQNINGPCPLLAICNILLLQGKISIHTDFSMVNYEQLVALLGDLLLSQKPPVNSDLEQNYNQNVADAVALFPTLQFGLDVNVRFRNITDFEFTPELTVFDLFNIRIVHGWLISPYDQDSYESIGNLSYNEVVERLVHLSEHEGDETKDLSRERKIRDFMNTTASQLTPYGLEKLHEEIGEAEFAVFFRNNHFSVLYKHEGILYLLVTDQGYLYQQKIMWELFDSVDGDSHFVCPEFILYKPEENTPENIVLNNELIADEQLAAQLQREEEEAQKNAATEARIAQEKADHEMAMMLQQEEQQAGNGAIQPAAAPAAQQTVSAAATPAPQQQVSLEHLYQAQQQGVQLTEEQTRQLNAFLSQRTESGDCAIM